ncbi:hypothetical protein [Candidatus Nitrosocosmicus hydrocola]|uniref:hypothetical protein n=1 Tax=Candidatus Nitrosocosmicus hydrocola TaxID=1826872 RepID=UPI00137369AE|nr:hypothetical protein [Candidatus Nitrosocosmicus hydrocola]
MALSSSAMYLLKHTHKEKRQCKSKKRLEETISDFLMRSHVLWAIVLLGDDGFGRRGK